LTFLLIQFSDLIKEGEKCAFNEIIETVIENEGKENALLKLKTFIDDIENEKIKSEENQYILKLTKEKLVELQNCVKTSSDTS
jgi:AAA+ ATPase superfamily predicted ATPase